MHAHLRPDITYLNAVAFLVWTCQRVLSHSTQYLELQVALGSRPNWLTLSRRYALLTELISLIGKSRHKH